MKKITTILLATSMMLTVLTGCGNPSASVGVSGSGESTTPEIAAPSSAETIMMADGEKELPTGTRFAVLSHGHFEDCIHLGVLPVIGPKNNYEPPEDLTALSSLYRLDGPMVLVPDFSVLDDVMQVNASDDGVDIEQLLEADLDFIISDEWNLEIADKLNKVAPTYFLPNAVTTDENGYKDWRETHRLIGKLVGKSDLAEQHIAEYDALAADYKAKVAEKFGGEMPTAFVTQISTKGAQYELPSSNPQVFDILGLEVPEGMPSEKGSLTVEQLVEIGPDYIFANIESSEDYDKMTSSPLWTSFPAGADDNVFEYSHHLWGRSSSSLAELEQLKQAGEFVLNGTQVTVRGNLK